MNSATETQNGIQKHCYSDLSLFALFISNLIVIAWALLEEWDVGTVLWIYWCQSIIIGFFWFIKILSLKRFSTKGVLKDGIPVKPNRKMKVEVALLFCGHFSIFHCVFLVFLIKSFASVKIGRLLPLVIVFFVYQSFSFFYNRKWTQSTKPNIGTMLWFPYARAMPMYLTIFIFGFDFTEYLTEKRDSMVFLLFFMMLKTFADLAMHAIERKAFSDSGTDWPWKFDLREPFT